MTESSSSKLQCLHPLQTVFPAPHHGISAQISSLRMNPIDSGMYLPPQHPSVPMDGPVLPYTYPMTPIALQPVLSTLKPFRHSHSDPDEKLSVSQLQPDTSGQERRDGCLDCQKSYFTFSSLSKQRNLHCEWQCKKYFSCKYCDKEYVSLGALKMHIRTHTLPCVCKLCGKAFSRPWLLQGHIRTHTGEKPFSCPHCSRAFADRSNLRAHLQTHSEIKKYQCRSCLKTFSRISLLSKHEEAGCCPMS
ncbi:zinc finger protein SNAI3 [Triplophysa dalaica]|uniref:zinc finger protein SNAI3 n=1 Tax=Triplophysa dalaica TaxID=1582913 RepID=UPI0024DFF886|nr:zinc finger protein SNAI3 [Triplophysa dalaica]